MATLDCSGYTLTGIQRGCRNNSGGIKRVWLFPFKFGMTTLGEDKQVSAIEVDKAEICEFEFAKNTATMSSVSGGSPENGTLYFTTTLNMQFNKVENVKRTAIMAAALGSFAAVVEDNNGTLSFLGYDTEVQSTDVSSESGDNRDAFSGYKISLVDIASEMPFIIPKAIWDAKLA